MSDLARRVGVSTKTLYAVFTSKEELITRIIQESIRELREREDLILHDKELDLIEKLRQLLGLLPNGFAGTNLRVWYELKRYYPMQWKLVEDFYQQEWEHVGLILDEGILAGIFRRIQLPILIQMYTGCLEQLVDQQALGKNSMTMGEALNAMIDILLGGVVRQETE
ncbi:TetR/AcrR family transcriptional regulator [Brevibacillus choshinensis]|nr:TetR/AcrR family transcriptional regulator [Brevibacillus choshinensis]